MAPLFEVVGKTTINLDGREVLCRMKECILGNLIADSYVYSFLESEDISNSWTKFPIALVPGGGIRSSIDVLSDDGEVTFADIKNVCPFGGEVVAINVTGEELYNIFEHSVSTWDKNMHTLEGRFLQVSGMKVSYNAFNSVGKRVASLKARCSQCTVPNYYDVVLNEIYTVIVTGYMKSGGDGYSMLQKKEVLRSQKVNDTGAVVKYFKEHKITLAEIQGRISFNSSDTCQCQKCLCNLNGSAFSVKVSYSLIITLIFIALYINNN